MKALKDMSNEMLLNRFIGCVIEPVQQHEKKLYSEIRDEILCRLNSSGPVLVGESKECRPSCGKPTVQDFVSGPASEEAAALEPESIKVNEASVRVVNSLLKGEEFEPKDVQYWIYKKDLAAALPAPPPESAEGEEGK